MKSLEQSHALQLRDLDYRHALELDERKHSAELRKFELEQQRAATPMGGFDAQPKPAATPAQREERFWESKLFVAIVTIALPVLLTFLLREDRRTGSSSRKRHGRHRTWK